MAVVNLAQNYAFSPPNKSAAALLTGGYGSRYEFVENELPVALSGEALIRIDYSGVCHGDVYSRDGGGPAPASPMRPLTGGHEGVGEIVSFASSQTMCQGFSIGDKVGIAWRSKTCEVCEACLCGAENHCPQQRIVGLHRNGTFQRYVTFSIDALVQVPRDLHPALACPILCAGVTSYVALRKLNPERNKWCVISGAGGGLGHLAIQYAKNIFGLRVLAIDGGSSEKEDFCKQIGCDEYVDFMKEGANLAAVVKERTGGGADYIMLLSPYQAAYDAAGEYARFRAHLVAVGIANCSMRLRPILQKDLTLRSSETGTKADIEEALDMSARGSVLSRVETLGLPELNEVLDRLKAGSVLGKVVIDLRSTKKTSLTSIGQRHSVL